jgi:hypothetical protein
MSKQKLSMRALFALQYFINSREGISAARLVPEVLEGRDAIRTALKELRVAGLITTRKERVGKDIKTVSYVTEAGFVEAGLWGLIIPPLIQHNKQNSNISNIYAYSANNAKKTTIDERLGEKKMGYEFFENNTASETTERERERLRAVAQRKKEYQEQKAKVHAEKAALRETREPKDWTVNQSALEFQEQMTDVWGIAPWRMAGTRFLVAFASARQKYDTNGQIEQEMMRIFFTQLKVNKETDADKLWLLFISKFSELATQARLRISSPEKMDAALADAEAQWKREFGEDFNV